MPVLSSEKLYHNHSNPHTFRDNLHIKQKLATMKLFYLIAVMANIAFSANLPGTLPQGTLFPPPRLLISKPQKLTILSPVTSSDLQQLNPQHHLRSHSQHIPPLRLAPRRRIPLPHHPHPNLQQPLPPRPKQQIPLHRSQPLTHRIILLLIPILPSKPPAPQSLASLTTPLNCISPNCSALCMRMIWVISAKTWIRSLLIN